MDAKLDEEVGALNVDLSVLSLSGPSLQTSVRSTLNKLDKLDGSVKSSCNSPAFGMTF